MKLKSLLDYAIGNDHFNLIDDYIDFSMRYLEFMSDKNNFQAEIKSQNESKYVFYQYREDGNLSISRPINSDLFYSAEEFDRIRGEFVEILKCVRELDGSCVSDRTILNNTIYTMQQTIGATLDALPSNMSNVARKRNGDIFEKLIRIIFHSIGIPCRSGVIKIPVKMDGKVAFKMSYQHDLIVEKDNSPAILGSIKTSSKDRIGKIFVDKFLYSKLTETSIPHIAIFLNDVQRKKPSKNQPERNFGINSTFLSGHFKGYTVKLNPLDGVYYCDMRPNMATEPIVKDHIKSLDHLLCEDIWELVEGIEFAK
jgi:hypothetical protein